MIIRLIIESSSHVQLCDLKPLFKPLWRVRKSDKYIEYRGAVSSFDNA